MKHHNTTDANTPIPQLHAENKKAKAFFPEHWHIIALLLAIYDIVVVNGA